MSSLETEQYKKEALQFILSIYLNRQNDEDIRFISQNIESTQNFAKNISSDINYGLSEQAVQRNKMLYGRNQKKVILAFSVADIFLKAIKSSHIFLFLTCLVGFILGTIWQVKHMKMQAVYISVIMIIGLVLKVITFYQIEKKQSNQGFDHNSNYRYRVLRSGNYVQLPQTKIVVGDIIELEYKEIIPASGLLISSQEISMNQEQYGKKIQRKMSIEKCAKYIKKLTLLEKKIYAQKLSLPSPIIVRGTEQVYGTSFKMLVISVDEGQLLVKGKTNKHLSLNSPVMYNWLQRIQGKFENVNIIIRSGYFVLFFLMFLLKLFLNRDVFTAKQLVQDLLTVSLFGTMGRVFFDFTKYRHFFQTQLMSFANDLINPKELEKYMTVQQIYITEDNIVKYDDIKIEQIAFPDKEGIINYNEINSVNQLCRNKAYEVLQKLGLKQVQQRKKVLQQKKRKSIQQSSDWWQEEAYESLDPSIGQIIHLNTVDQKIFSWFYTKYAQQGVHNDLVNAFQLFAQRNQADSKALFVQQQSMESNASLNKDTTLDLDNNKVAQKKSIKKSKKLSKKINQNNQTSNVQEKVYQDDLKGYLNEFCKFKTQNIIKGICQLAKKQFRTYYYKKYNLSHLKHIEHCFVNGHVVELTKQRVQKIKKNVKSIRIYENLTPYIIGYSEGAYSSSSSMDILVAVIGVKVNFKNQIIQRLKSLRQIGIKSSVLIYKKEQDQIKDKRKRNSSKQCKSGQNLNILIKKTSDNENHMTKRISSRISHSSGFQFKNQEPDQIDEFKRISQEFKLRDWIAHESEEITDFEKIRSSGGGIRCGVCFISNCDCKEKKEQLCNIQGFMSICDNIKIIHSLQTQNDINYIQTASEQICNSTILITKYKADTIKILDDIRTGYSLSGNLQRGLSFWISHICSLAFTILPISLVTFGDVFCPTSIAILQLGLHTLPIIGHIKVDGKQPCNQHVQYGSRRSKILFTNKSTILVFTLWLLCTVLIACFYIEPSILIEQSSKKLAQFLKKSKGISMSQECIYERSVFLNQQFQPLSCKLKETEQRIMVYSKNTTIAFAYIMFVHIIFCIANFRDFLKLEYVGIIVLHLSTFVLVIFIIPQTFQGRYDGLTWIQLFIILSLALATNLIAVGVACISDLKFFSFQCDEFQSVLSFDKNIQNHYSTKLKKYAQGDTFVYSLRD